MQWKIKAEGKINEKGEMKNAECKGNAMENKGNSNKSREKHSAFFILLSQ
jgi:hypothetical protein